MDTDATPGTSSVIQDPPQQDVRTAKRTKGVKRSKVKTVVLPPDNLANPESKEKMLNTVLNVTGKHENLTYIADLIWTAIDEIALEGLDGITLEAFWKRMSTTLGQPLPFSRALEIFLWDSLRQMNDLNFYKLPVAREPLIVCDRYKNCDAETGHMIEMDDLPPDIYPISMVKDSDNNILGSCSYYKERVDITDSVREQNLDEVIKFGNTMVIVANQKLRFNALVPNTSNPLINLCDTSYCILERIGRSRYIGELTCGKVSLAIICKDAKTSFYYRKTLLKNNLIAKQPFCLRTTNRQNTIGNMFHLQRFYNERKSRKQVMIEQIVKMLKSRPNYRMEYMELRRIVGDENWEKMGFVKLIKSDDFRQIVKTDLNLLYREVYPNAKPSEWRRKSCPKEKLVRVLELINPNLNVALAKDDDGKDSSSDEEAVGDQLMRVPDSKQIYDLIYNSGRNGMFLKQLQKIYGLDFYTVRAIIKLLLRKNLITSHMVDSGRQRYSKYYAKCFDKEEVYQKFLEKFENPKSSSDSETDEETLDFIAKTLKVDSAKLKNNKIYNSSNKSKEVDCKLSNDYKNKYHLVKEIRVRNTCFDRAEKFKVKPDVIDNLERLDDKKLLQEVYSNQHVYVSHEESVKENLIVKSDVNIKITSNFTNIVSGICNVENKKPIKSIISSTTKLTTQPAHLRYVPIKKFRKFSHPLNRLFLKSPNSSSKNCKIYFAKVGTLVATFVADAEANKELPTNFLSSDEDEILDDSDSIMPVGFESVQTKDNCDEEKSIIISNFETNARLAAHFGIEKVPEMSAKRKTTFEESVLTKKIKLEVAQDITQDKLSTTEQNLIESGAKDLTESEQKVTELNVTALTSDSIRTTQGDIFDATMEAFMGPKPVLVYQDFDEDDVETRVVMSSNIEDFTDSKTMTISERVQKRVKCITEAVAKHKVISDLSKLLQMIIQSERKEGYNVTVDRKSLLRIYAKLVREGVIKMVKILVKYENIIRSKNIIIHPDVDVQSVVKSAIEQFKLSFVLYAKRKVQEDPNVKPEVISDDVNVQEKVNEKPFMEGKFDLKTENKVKYRYSRTIGRTYGYYPKIAKMRVLHEFLYYLLYAYDGVEIPSEEVKNILPQHCDSVDDKLVKDCSTLYQKEASWKMFIPPLPVYKNWTDGWLLICDALLRLPLSIFVKIFNISYIIPELPKYYLNHPIRKHFLVRNIPPDIRDAILSYRKYIFSIHEVFSLLCYLGIVQFGPQKFREKDQLFIYLNKNAILYDTSTSDPGYHHISKSNYPKLNYNFKSIKEVEKYWNDMYRISMNTKLGQRTTVLGKYISLENIHCKKDMVEILKPQTPESAAARDTAYLPGDNLGACCADSALWLHVKRNWVWTTQRNKISNIPAKHMITGLRKKHMEDVKPLKFTECFKQNVKNTIVKPSSQVHRSRKVFTKPGMTFKKKAILRKMVPRKPTKKRAEIDNIDKEIIKKMGKSRATFCKEEDNLIYLCRAVVEYLCPYNRKRAVVHSAIRDFIHRILPYSRKTSTAYKRRCIQLKKQENLQEENQTFSFNLGSDYFTQKHFRRIRDKIVDITSIISEKEMSLTFLYLAYYIYKQWKLNPKSKTLEADLVKDYLNLSDIPKYHQALTLDDEDSFYQEPSSEDDINLDTIKSVIHSSLGYQNASHEWPYQLLKVYQSFSEHLLRTALNCLRDQQLISGKKASTKHSGGKEGSILMRGTSYHLSFAYTFKQITKYPNYIFNEAHDFFVGLHNHIGQLRTTGHSIENFAQGHGLGLSEIALRMTVSYAFNLPDDLISLDPSVNDHRDLVKELALRYKTLMLKKNQDNDVEENDPEDPDVCDRLETVLDSFIRSEFSKDAVAKEKLQEEFDNFASLFNQKQTNESSDDIQMNTDRRQKGLRISDLAFLLTKGLFPELDDDERLEKLNRHFMVRYPTCNFYLADQPVDKLLFKKCHSVITRKADKIIAKLKKGCIVQNSMPSEDTIMNIVISSGGNDVDKTKVDEIVNFIYAKNMFGASSEQLRRTFEVHGNLTLDQLLVALIKSGVIIRVGITNFAFVHFSYRHNWSIYLDSSKNPDLENNSVGYRVIIAPWIKIDGAIHIKVLNNWLNIILSHCLSFPFIPLISLCKRFCYIKPIDVFAILEILQELTCLRIMSYENSKNPNLFSGETEISSGPAKITDDFKKIFIETDDMAIIKFGAYLDKDKVDYNVPFVE